MWQRSAACAAEGRRGALEDAGEGHAGQGPARAAAHRRAEKAVEATFLEARKLVKQAREFKSAGEAIEKTQGRQAANDTLVKAKKLFKEAAANTEDWIEPDLGKVTEGQVKDYLQSYNNERAAWLKDISSLGKLHDDK